MSDCGPSAVTRAAPGTSSPATDAPDVLVVGGGLAGCFAALVAAHRRPDAAVEVLVTDGDRFDRHPGTIDVLGYLPGGTESGPVETPLDALDELPGEHPLGRLGRERLRNALAVFDDALGYRGADSEANALVVTHAGRVRPTARYPAGMAAGLASRAEPMQLVGFEQAPDLDAPLVADLLGERLPYGVAGLTVEFPGTVTGYPSGPTLARALDGDEPPRGDVGVPEPDADIDVDGEMLPDPAGQGGDVEGSVREQLVERVLAAAGLEPRVGFPAVLGVTEHATIRGELEGPLHADVFEVPIGPPSVPGRRLERRLRGALADAGVAVTHGSVEGFEAADGHIERVSLADGERAVESVVLATGDLSGPGLVADRAGIHEPVFGCHVDHPGDRLEWTEPDFAGAHAFARFGVAVDEELRPVDTNGRPEYDNLRAAGRIIGGFDYDAEQSADGVALVTGHAAGRWSLP